MAHPLLEVVKLQGSGKTVGVYSVCSAQKQVLEAAMLQAKKDDSILLIEATSNQVDQFGGYTGMTPKQFKAYVNDVAAKMDFPFERIILGGDHLGPNAWQNQPSIDAMGNARVLMQTYVQAGFQKIHLDASMRCADDPGTTLDPEISVARAAVLCKECEENKLPGRPLYYIIGTEVPIPGGAKENLEEIEVTPASEAKNTIELTQKAFVEQGLEDAWERVIAVVVQPGVEFGDESVVEYDRDKANALSSFINGYQSLVYEAHSTDYQTPQALGKMVEDGFAILKVGPWLTFAFREAVFSLATIESEIIGGFKGLSASCLTEVVDRAMISNPVYWQSHYFGNAAEKIFARKYSYSDRIRYYWPNPDIQSALKQLLDNLSKTKIPLTILRQFMPVQYEAVRSGEISPEPLELIRHKIMEVTEIYSQATRISEIGMN